MPRFVVKVGDGYSFPLGIAYISAAMKAESIKHKYPGIKYFISVYNLLSPINLNIDRVKASSLEEI